MPTLKSYSKNEIKTAGLSVESNGVIPARAGPARVCPLRVRHWHAGLLTGILGVTLTGLHGVTSQPTSLLLVVPGLELNQSQTACAALN